MSTQISISPVIKLEVNTTPITGGSAGQILFQTTGNTVGESSNLFWDATNNRLGIGTSTPSAIIHSVGSVTASGSIARGNFFNNALVASANNDVLVGLDIQPTFTNGAFTGLENIPLRFVSQSNSNVVKNILLKNIGTGNGTGVSIGFNNLNANNLSHAFIKSYYVVPSGMAMSFGTGGGSSLTSEGTTALVLNADQTANFTARVIANSGGFQAIGVSANMLMSDGGTPVITRNGSTGIQFLKDAYWQTFSIFTNNTENLRVASTGNVLIGTTTDAGFKLDVNGTARVQGNFNVSGGQGITTINPNQITGGTDFFVVRTTSFGTFITARENGNLFLGPTAGSRAILYEALTFSYRGLSSMNFNNGGAWVPSNQLNQAGLYINASFTNAGAGATSEGSMFQFQGNTATTVGDVTLNQISMKPTYNNTGGTTINRGIYYNPTLTSLTGTTHYAFHSTSGRVRFEGLPTSSAGLSSGDIWNDGGTLKIV